MSIAVKVIKKQKGAGDQDQLLIQAVDSGDFFVISYSPRIDETAIFPASSDGKILNYGSLGETGGKSFDYALEDADMHIVHASANLPPVKIIRFKGATYKLATASPFFEHDCDECIYLGSAVKPNGVRADFYLSDTHGDRGGTALVRWSSNPSSNATLPVDLVLTMETGKSDRFAFWKPFYYLYKQGGK